MDDDSLTTLGEPADEDAFKRSCSFLRSNVILDSLIVTFSLSDENAYFLGSSLIGNTTLRQLSIRIGHQCLTERGAQMMSNGIAGSHLTHLALLSTTRDEFLDDFPYFDAENQLLLHGLAKCQTLTSLEIASPFREYAYILTLLPSLERLKISHKHSTKTSCPLALAESLSCNSSLRELELLYWRCQDDGDMVLLIDALRRNTALKRLKLEKSYLGDYGVEGFVQNWHPDSALEEIHFANTSITAAGAKLLIQAIAYHPTMRVLDLSGNELSYDGIKIIGEGLPTMRLRALNIGSCLKKGNDDNPYYWGSREQIQNHEKRRDKAFQVLVDGVKANQYLTKLDFAGNGFSDNLGSQIDYYTTLNLWRQRLLSADHELPPLVWCSIIAKHSSNKSLVCHLLQEMPHLMMHLVVADKG